MTDSTTLNNPNDSNEDSSNITLLSIRNDYVFKRVFSNKPILASFLTAYLGFDISENDIELDNPINGPLSIDSKCNLPDLKLSIKINSKIYGRFDIEMQTTSYKHLWKRFLHSTANMYAEQLLVGDEYKKLNDTFTIVIYGCNCIDEDDACCHRFYVNDPIYHINYEYSFQIHVLELPKRNTIFVNKHLKGNKYIDDLYQWLNLLSSNTEEEYMNAAMGSPERQSVVNFLQRISKDPLERAMADAAMYAKANEIALVDEGRDEREREIVQKMLNKNLPFETISEYTGISLERITEIKSKL